MTDFSALLEGLHLQDETQVQAGGQRLELIPEGKCPARIVGYIDPGHHMSEFKGEAKKVNEVVVIFEMIGKRVPRANKDGVDLPRLEFFPINRSFSDKSKYPKTVSRLAFTGEQSLAAMAVKRVPVMLDIKHGVGQKTGNKYMSLKDEAGILAVSAPVKTLFDDEGNPVGEAPLALPQAQHAPILYIYSQVSQNQIDTLDLSHWSMRYLVQALEFPGSRLESEMKSRGIDPATFLRKPEKKAEDAGDKTPEEFEDTETQAEKIAKAVEKVNQLKNPLPKAPAKQPDPAPEVADLDDQDFE